jgi:ferredoxin
MRVSVDSALCTGHARCWEVNNTLFALDEHGNSSIGEGRLVPPGSEQAARIAVSSCPERALTISE